MTLQQALTQAREQLASSKDIEDLYLESEVLLRYVLQIDRAQLHLELNRELKPDKGELFRQWTKRRLQGEPLAYIIQCREFFGLDFYVDDRVLIPRPETELLVEEALKLAKNYSTLTIADIGTGSGAIAVSLAVNLCLRKQPFDSQQLPKIYATDISPAALEVAAINCRKHNVAGQVTLLQGDLLEPLPTPANILIANLPYVKKADISPMPSARYEPTLALDGGGDGLNQIFRLSSQLKGRLQPNGCALLEIGLGQSPAVTNFLHGLFPSAVIEVKPDLAGIERMVKIRL